MGGLSRLRLCLIYQPLFEVSSRFLSCAMPSLVPRLAKAYCFECLFWCTENSKENHPPPLLSLSYPYQPTLLHEIQEALMLDRRVHSLQSAFWLQIWLLFI